MSVFMVCGYRRTGKDTLCLECNQEKEFNWVVYKHPSSPKDFKIQKVIRVSFADGVKKEVLCQLGLFNQDYTIVEQNKDHCLSDVFPSLTELIKEGKIDGSKTLRDYFIQHGQHQKTLFGNDYWSQKAFQDFNQNGLYMVTDWRFPEEYRYIKNNIDPNVTTIRVFRKNVLAKKEEEIEHLLDNVETDFVLIPRINNQKEWQSLLSLFPFYQDYIQVVD